MKRSVFLAILVLAAALVPGTASAAAWVQQQTPAISETGFQGLKMISFGDPAHGCAMGNIFAGGSPASVLVLTTSDGGATWVRAADIHPWDLFMTDLQMLDGVHGWATAISSSGVGMIYSTSNGGGDWDLRLLTPQPVLALDFPDAGHGWVAGPGGALYATTDGGASWQDRVSPQLTMDVLGIDFVDPLHGCLIGGSVAGPQLNVTNDGCVSYVLTRSPYWMPSAVALRDASHGLVAEANGIWTLDGGDLVRRYDRTGCSLHAVAFADQQHAFAVGATLPASGDGGLTWHEGPMPVTATYWDLSCLDARHAWAAGVSPSTIIAYDAAPPITTASGVDALWHKTSQTVRFSSVDGADTSGRSGIASITCQILPLGAAGQTVTAGDQASLTIPADLAHHLWDGATTIRFFALDKAGNLEAPQTVTVRIDTRRPRTVAVGRAKARRGRIAVLKYVVYDTPNNGGKATVTIKIRDQHHKVVRTLKLGLRRVNVLRKAKFRCTLPTGRYRYSVYVADLAGNRQKSVGTRTLIVK